MSSIRNWNGLRKRHELNNNQAVNGTFGRQAVFAILLGIAGLLMAGQSVPAQRRVPPKKSVQPAKPTNQLAILREQFVKATNEYKASLTKLLAIHENNNRKEEERLVQSRMLHAEGLISKKQLEEAEKKVAEAKDKITQTRQQLETADTQIANIMVEADAEAKIAKAGKLARGSLVRTTSYIRFNGSAEWSLADAWKVQRFFQDNFKRPLPIGVFGQGEIHNRWRLDHRNSMDLSIHPDGVEGLALINFLRSNGIPFLAFREAIPGAATGPHIHVGRPSHRY